MRSIMSFFSGLKRVIDDMVEAYDHIHYRDNLETSTNQLPLFINNIIVPTETDKEELLRVFEYIHNIIGDVEDKNVYNFCHLYLFPDMIKVKK